MKEEQPATDYLDVVARELEPMPDHVTASVDGVRYVSSRPAPSRATTPVTASGAAADPATVAVVDHHDSFSGDDVDVALTTTDREDDADAADNAD